MNVEHVVVVAIVFGSLVTIVRIIFHRPRHGRQFVESAAHEDWAALAALADRLNARIETLERVLDASQPDWRGKP
jgi:phage shock protein B